ncbi:MAG: hypothetical protein LBS88_13110 [Tannerellaceae bacterium]|jgi:hypothetical protein|nr:hypothetical protein [Tannerellaceae bacterium]
MNKTIILSIVTLGCFLLSCGNKNRNDLALWADETFYNDSVPDVLKGYSEIEFMSADGSDRIKLILKGPAKINQEFPPLLEIGEEEKYWIYFTDIIPKRDKCVTANFADSVHKINVAIGICNSVPQVLHLDKSEENSLYKVANYTTYEIFEEENEDNPSDYFDEVFNEIEQNSNRTDNIPQVIKDLVPSGYELVFCATGNLNLDKYKDAIVVLKKNDGRSIWLMTGNANNSYKINVINNEVENLGLYYFDDKRDFENPFFDIVIKNGFFTIENYGGVSGNNKEIHTAHFRYSQELNDWLLFRADYVPSRFLAGNCCFDFHLTKYYMEKIVLRDYKGLDF